MRTSLCSISSFFHVWNIMASGCIMIRTAMTVQRQQYPIFSQYEEYREKADPRLKCFRDNPNTACVLLLLSFCTAPSQLRLAWLHRLPGTGYPERRCDQPVQLQARLQHRHRHIATLCQVGDSPAIAPRLYEVPLLIVPICFRRQMGR